MSAAELAPEQALRNSLTTALQADPTVQAVLGTPVRLFDAPDRRAAYPHASWGRSESRARDADGVQLIEHRLNLDVWCRDSDPATVLGPLRAALRGLTIDLPQPWALITLAPAYSDSFTTREPRVRRGLIRLRAVMGQTLPPSAQA